MPFVEMGSTGRDNDDFFLISEQFSILSLMMMVGVGIICGNRFSCSDSLSSSIDDEIQTGDGGGALSSTGERGNEQDS